MDLENLFLKGRPFTNLVVASLTVGLALGLLGFLGGFAGFLVTAAILAGVSFLGLGVPYLLRREQAMAHLPEQEHSPQIARGASLEHCLAPEPERKTGMELVEKGNQAETLGRGR